MDRDEMIFNYLDPQSNDKLSNMKGTDLLDLIILINKYYLQLRNELGLDSNITFGLELEVENANRIAIAAKVGEAFNHQWDTGGDSTLNEGAEINSPVLRDNTKTWEDLAKVCDIVSPLASICDRSGGHVHIGTQLLGENRKDWLNFIKLWSVYENVIFRFGYGNFLNARETINTYAGPVAKDFWDEYNHLMFHNASLELILNTLTKRRYQAVNFRNVHRIDPGVYDRMNTIEFRCPNGSLDPVIWQNNVNLFVKLLMYAKNSAYDDDLIEKRHELIHNKNNDLQWYNEIYLDQALELSDMLFDNNLDKVYFLKQYLKEYQVYDNNGELKKSPVLTKKKM